MEVVMNHTQFLEWKYGNKTTLNIKLENLGVKDSEKFEDELILRIGTTLLVASNIICGFSNLKEMNLLGCLLTSITPNDYAYWVQYGTCWLECSKVQKKFKRSICTY
ncbi:hypothetical protein DIC82_12840 [Clostridium beijerinckii]|nr:hypothetical protein DIC82_12840 [Clostridium beijerinckii]